MSPEQKKYTIPLALLLAAFFILFKVVYPEFISIVKVNSQITQIKKELQDLANITNILNNSYEDVTLDKNLSVVNSALPAGKNVLDLFLGISNAGLKSGLNIKNFSFSLGNIIDVKTENSEQATSLSLDLSANNLANIADYSSKLYNLLPLSNINKISFARGQGATFTVNFYYKPYDLIFIANHKNVAALSVEEKNLIDLLSKMLPGK